MSDPASIARKLNQFRRHPDWGTAFERTRHRRRDLFFKLDDGRWAINDDNAQRLIELSDQEFIETIIRSEHPRAPEAVT